MDAVVSSSLICDSSFRLSKYRVQFYFTGMLSNGYLFVLSARGKSIDIEGCWEGEDLKVPRNTQPNTL